MGLKIFLVRHLGGHGALVLVVGIAIGCLATLACKNRDGNTSSAAATAAEVFDKLAFVQQAMAGTNLVTKCFPTNATLNGHFLGDVDIDFAGLNALIESAGCISGTVSFSVWPGPSEPAYSLRTAVCCAVNR